MTKGTRKTNRRLKKTVRKTLGTLFLISAIVVAAIPTEGLRAADDTATQAAEHTHANLAHAGVGGAAKYKVSIPKDSNEKNTNLPSTSTVTPMDKLIPVVDSDATIYTTDTNADGTSYQFAYVYYNGSYCAVLLGYNKDTTLTNNELTIPVTVNAYIQPTGNEGTVNGYVAASKSGEPLYYEVFTEHTREVDTGTKDDAGSPIMETVTYYTGEMRPCYTNDNAWKELADKSLDQFFVKSSGSSYTSKKAIDVTDGTYTTYQKYDGFMQTINQDHQWIKDLDVKYIGNQYLTPQREAAGTYTWKVSGFITDSNPNDGIFAGASNITTLNIGNKLVGVGNYAFYGCNGLQSVSFGNGVTVFGNWAFANCGSLENYNIDRDCNLAQIGDHAFYNCTSLKNVNIPKSVQFIGDYAFANCRYLYSVEMCNADKENGVSASSLKEIGWNVFENCETLYSLAFPNNYSETIDISLVKGCKNLHYISSTNPQFNITEKAEDVYCFDCFKAMLNGEPVEGTFYFEGEKNSNLHQLCRDNCFAFSYIEYKPSLEIYEKKNQYELTVQDPNVLGEPGRSTFIVDSSNQLLNASVGTGVKTLNIPDPIGPYHIYNISANTFANNCNLTMVSLPASVQSVGDGAFHGCHNLATVIFNNSSIAIGTDAFKTQDFTGTHRTGCTHSTATAMNDADNSPAVKLTFVGEISPESTPYKYAMSPDGRYNNSSQVATYVRYCSGWPSNLVVQYNPEKSVSELIDFPAFTELTKYLNKNDYPYLTDAQRSAAETALTKYTAGESLTEDQQQFIDSALNVTIPEGVQAIKDDLFVEKEKDQKEKTLTIYGLDSIEENDFKGAKYLTGVISYSNTLSSIAKNAFDGCEKLATVEINGNTQSIGDYAFKDCVALKDVSLSGTISSLGNIPFTGCKILDKVGFQGTDYFTCDNSIIYGMNGSAKAKIIECLEGRTSKRVNAKETTGVTEMAPEAFRGCDNLTTIDLSDSAITVVPSYAFAETKNLDTVKLPITCEELKDNVFNGSSIKWLEESSERLTVIAQDTFNGMLKAKGDVTLCAPKTSYLYRYGDANGFAVEDTPLEEIYTVIFRDWNEELKKNVPVDEQQVRGGEDAVPPTPLGKTGEVFKGWDGDYTNITEDTTCTAIYEKEDPDAAKFTVTFLDWDDKVVKEIKVSSGGSIADSDLPNVATLVRDGYIFTGWDRDLTNITSDITTKAVYKALSEDDIVVRYINGVTKEIFYQTTIKKGTVAPSIQTPAVSGYTFKEWLPDIAAAITENTDFYAVYVANGSNGNNSGTTSPGASTSPGSNNNGTTAKMYTLTVKNGSGSGSYIAGSQPIIVANDPAANQQFSSWSIDPSNTKIASKVLSATVITMPEANVTVTANYTAKSGSGRKTSTSTGSGNSTNSNSNRRPSSTTTGTVSGGRTTVVIDKNGLSNTGVVSATVNGSSDNFVIKITESAAASEEVVKALMAEYGSDISAIKYFPMDISLYDSTGNTKITDTTGLSISITLPLPDSLITYAGNNKVAGVVNSKLDKLSPKFSTISGVSCVTFTAEHFSPYVIYVDTNNLTAGTIADSTPKTGDGIHPKWFLSMGLACLSIVFFMKKDKKTLKAARV